MSEQAMRSRAALLMGAQLHKHMQAGWVVHCSSNGCAMAIRGRNPARTTAFPKAGCNAWSGLSEGCRCLCLEQATPSLHMGFAKLASLALLVATPSFPSAATPASFTGSCKHIRLRKSDASELHLNNDKSTSQTQQQVLNKTQRAGPARHNGAGCYCTPQPLHRQVDLRKVALLLTETPLSPQRSAVSCYGSRPRQPENSEAYFSQLDRPGRPSR